MSVGPALRSVPTVPEERVDVGPALPSATTIPETRTDKLYTPCPTERSRYRTIEPLEPSEEKRGREWNLTHMLFHPC